MLTLLPAHAERYVFKYRHTDALSLSGALNIGIDEVLGTAVAGYIGEQ